jgi:hypothetical protein
MFMILLFEQSIQLSFPFFLRKITNAVVKLVLLFLVWQAQDDYGKWRQIPAFGDWNHLWDDMPVAQYFDPAATFFFTAQAGEDDVDLFKVPHFAANPYNYKKVSVITHYTTTTRISPPIS